MTPEPTARLRETLLAAVPPLPEPPDRLAQIGLRVRRARRRAVAASALAVALILGGAFGLADASRRGPLPAAPAINDCPVWPADVLRPHPVDTPGPLVPPGAVRVTQCSVPRGGPLAGGSARALTRQVDQLAATFNALPDAALGSSGYPEAQPGTAFADRGCTAVAYSHDQSFVFRYPDRPPVVVWFDQNCGTMTTTGHARVLLAESPLDWFSSLYRAQLRATTRPADIRTPACPASIAVADLDQSTGRSPARDDIAPNRARKDPFLPDPLVAAAACRYAISGQQTSLAGQARRRTDLDPLRGALNDVTAMLPNPGSDPVELLRNLGRVQPTTDCGDTGRPELLDVLLVADATGAVAEARVWRRPCLAFFHASSPGHVPTEAVLSTLDRLLGPAA